MIAANTLLNITSGMSTAMFAPIKAPAMAGSTSNALKRKSGKPFAMKSRDAACTLNGDSYSIGAVRFHSGQAEKD